MSIFNKKPKEVKPVVAEKVGYLNSNHMSVLFIDDRGYLHISVTGSALFTPEELEELKDDVNNLIIKFNKKLEEK